jgi:hypothetical protein
MTDSTQGNNPSEGKQLKKGLLSSHMPGTPDGTGPLDGVVFYGVNVSDSSDSSVSSAKLPNAKDEHGNPLQNRYGQLRLWDGAASTGYYRPAHVTSTDPWDVHFNDSIISSYEVVDPSLPAPKNTRELKIASFLGLAVKKGARHVFVPATVTPLLAKYPEVASWLKSLGDEHITSAVDSVVSLQEGQGRESFLLEGMPIVGKHYGVPLRGILTGNVGRNGAGVEHLDVQEGSEVFPVNVSDFIGVIGDPNGDHLVAETGGYLTAVPADRTKLKHAVHSVLRWSEQVRGEHPADASTADKGTLLSALKRAGKPHMDAQYKSVMVRSSTSEPELKGAWLTGRYYKYQGRTFVEINPPPGKTGNDWLDLGSFSGELYMQDRGYGARYENGKITELLGAHPNHGYNQEQESLPID